MTPTMQNGFTVWFTGLSGAGKSTISTLLMQKLKDRGFNRVELLDGDLVRTHLSKGLGFSKEDRDTNIGRIGFVAGLLARNGAIALTAAISPYRETRDRVRDQIENFVEVYVTAPLETLVQRDVKGLYQRALAGEISNFTGVSDPYEPPLSPEVIVETDKETVEISVNKVLRALEVLGLIPVAQTLLPETEELKVISKLRQLGKLRTNIITPTQAPNRESSSNGWLAPIPPHGGILVNRFLQEEKRNELLDRLEKYPSLTLSRRQWSDIALLATGAYSPLIGFLGARDFQSVIHSGRLTSGLAWTIPILLLIHPEQAEDLHLDREVVLRDRDGKNLAILYLEEIYRVDKEQLALKVWRTADQSHPGVKVLYEEGALALGGPIEVIRLQDDSALGRFHLTPPETREYFLQQQWRTVVAFQTRNPVHRAHEYIQKAALETMDGLLLHPLVGEVKADDIPADVRLACYRVLLEHYYPKDRVLLATMPAAMRYAGPKEAIHHAIMRQNYGCTHFIVGRDHAGVGDYYGTYEAQRIFDEYSRDELAIAALKFENTFYCRKCSGMASEKTCPHDQGARVHLSGTKVRERLEQGLALPAEFSRPEVAEILRAAYGRKNNGAQMAFDKNRAATGDYLPSSAHRVHTRTWEPMDEQRPTDSNT
ncbi:MAG: sulfate adenylyltransferase [bacterium]